MFVLTTTQQAPLVLTPIDSRGNPATIDLADYAPIWTSSDTSVANVIGDPNDPSKALVVAVGVGTAEISVQADADLDAGEERLLPASVTVEVVRAEAVLLEVGVGEIVEQPPAE